MTEMNASLNEAVAVDSAGQTAPETTAPVEGGIEPRSGEFEVTTQPAAEPAEKSAP
jgi:hypothetical protein